ncbi:18463_t:CDS:2 [Racocetra fulgida]|uniref:18463_t:CDS:1 n=1 Tax=Racocetra fulgida TaxID=60492 RepID=A0A9N9DKP2_9GLOM|nr:18463_t:CDS:2 [Racocetra fulgida]
MKQMNFKAIIFIVFATFALSDRVIAGNPYDLINITYDLGVGYFYDYPVEIYSFDEIHTNGPLAPTTFPYNPIYIFLKDLHDDISNVLQPNIIEFIPGDKGYSDLKQVVIVTGRKENDPHIKSYEDLKRLGNKELFQLIKFFFKVGFSSDLTYPEDAPSKFGYYNGGPIHYFDFGINPAGNKTVPIYHVIDKNYNILSTLPSTIPGFKDYSAMWAVFNITVINVPVKKITSLDQVSHITPIFSDLLVNCPISTNALKNRYELSILGTFYKINGLW